MFWSELLLSAAYLLQGVHSITNPTQLSKREAERHILEFSARAFADNPSGDYAPSNVSCPSANLIRSASGISTDETTWLKGRTNVTNAALVDLLTRANMTDFDVASFMSKYTPIVGLAFSGGGYRAMIAGAGVLSAFDSRTANSTGKGGVGGLLQSATYLAGLSGGSWLVGSIVVNNFTSVQDIIGGGELWDLENSILNPAGGFHIVSTAEYYADLIKEVSQKSDAGYDVTLTDYWGRALSRQFVNATDGGPAVTFSSIADSDQFKAYTMPFPIITADGRAPGETIVSLNATNYEFNPFEFGSFDPTLYAFTRTKYIGTNMNQGVPEDSSVCVNGFDNAGYVMGTSSSLFNSILLNLNSTGLESVLKDAISSLLNSISSDEDDIARYFPNPFFGVSPTTFPSSNTKNLTLVDGGEDLQNIPLNPLIQPARAVDVIFANDNSADVVTSDGTTVNWPNGTSLVATYQRSLGEIENGTQFPAIPDQATFVNLKLNTRPTFFGCNASNFSHPATAPPLIVYIPNAPYTAFSNTSTYQLSYENSQRNDMIQNGYNVATLGNGTADAEWPACVGCAIIQRQVERNGGAHTAQCISCMQRYCWNGTRDSTPPPTYEPQLGIVSKSDGNRSAPSHAFWMGTFFAGLMHFFS